MNTQFSEMLKPFLTYLGDSPITADTPLRELGLDSMQAIELMFALEDTFGVQLPDEALVEETFRTAGNLWNAVAGAMPVGAASSADAT
jgi:acyl carrier protein